jgi:putative exporter of polyketide antibiotics
VDVLLGLPVSRFQVYLAETLVWLASVIVLSGLLVLGNRLGTFASRDGRPLALGVVAAIVTNFIFLHAAVAGLGWLASSLAKSRPRAIAAVFSILLASFLLNFLAQLWPVAKHIAFSSILTYYRPLRTIDGAAWPLGDLAVLGGVAFACWGAGAFALERRDISTV